MAKLLNKEQRIQVGVKNPTSIYSRVVGLNLPVTLGSGVSSYVFTPAMGERLRVLGIDAYFWGYLPLKNIGGFIYIAAGSGVPADAEVIACRWRLLVPTVAGGKPGLYWWGADAHFSWTMNLLLKGQPWRFGVTIENGFGHGWYATFYFEISEG